MIIEAVVASAPDIVLFAIRGQGHAGEILPAFCFTNHLASAAIRQSQVTHNRVEVFRSQKCKRAFHIVRCGNGMTEMPEQAGQDAASIAVILDHQYLQGHNSGKTSRGHERPRPVTTIEMAAPFGCFKQRKNLRGVPKLDFGNESLGWAGEKTSSAYSNGRKEPHPAQ